MINLTSFERTLHRALVAHAKLGQPDTPTTACISYAHLGREVDPEGSATYPMTRPPFRGFNEALGHVSWYEVEHGRPMLSALVVNEATRRPGEGFTKLAAHLGLKVANEDRFWQDELRKVVRFWSADDMVLVVDAATDAILRQLNDLKGLIRRRDR